MSHIVTIAARVTDPAAIAAACQRLNLAAPVQGTARLFSGQVSGLLVQFPGWQFPAVINTASGSIKFDNYNGRWGEQGQLDRFMQMYSVERAKAEARKKGYSVTEQTLQDGSIKVQVIERN